MANHVDHAMSEETGTVQVILEVGAAGGSLTLVGVRSAQGWQFQRKVNDCTPLLIDEGPAISHESHWVDSWKAALKILDEYPWHRLYPTVVHPDFAQRIWKALKKRLDKDILSGRRLPNEVNMMRWRSFCGKDLDRRRELRHRKVRGCLPRSAPWNMD